MHYFYNTLGIVFGIILPWFLFLLFGLIIDIVQSNKKKWEYLNKRDEFFNIKWRFKGTEKCPNDNYISLIFKDTDDNLNLSIALDKKNLISEVSK